MRSCVNKEINLINKEMTPIEFLNSDECPNLKNGMGLNEIQISIIAEIMQAYTDKQLRIGGVIERFSIGQPVKWEGMKFWVAEDNGNSKVLVCNCEDTKDIQQTEYNDWWVDRDVLNAL